MKPVISLVLLCLLFVAVHAEAASFDYRHPRPSGYAENGAAPGPQALEFTYEEKVAGVTHDLAAKFPKGATPEFEVTRVAVNGAERTSYLVVNNGVINGNRRVHGSEDFSILTYVGWEPGRQYRIEVEGKDSKGQRVQLAQAQAAPAERAGVKSVSFGSPTAEDPYHSVTVVLAKEAVNAGTVSSVEVDGKVNRDARVFQEGEPASGAAEPPSGESYARTVDGERNVRIVVPVDWVNGSEHTVLVTVAPASGEPQVFEATGTAAAKGGYWNAQWPHSHSLVLTESAGIRRVNEPVRIAIALFTEEVSKPEAELRVVTYNPDSPDAGADGYVLTPFQVLDVDTWNDPNILGMEEKDAETGELVHRFDPTTTVELVFAATVEPYESRVYQVLYGNPQASAPAFDSALNVKAGQGLAQTVENEFYRYETTPNSGAVDTITIKGEGDPVLLEHKIETNGAVHWNPEFYSPPSPWVHASDWGIEQQVPGQKPRQFAPPQFSQSTGPVMHRTERFAPLPQQEHATVAITYEFYAGQPYTLMRSYEEIAGDHFVQALRNNELVFNKKVFNEFVYVDPEGKVQSLDLLTSQKHPTHAIEIPGKTPWMAFINRDMKVGFASIHLTFENGNRYGKLSSEAQPYIYVQNGPWYYFSRPIVYPFGGKNFTRMMPVRDGSFYLEKSAWLPFRFTEGDNPFAEVEKLQKQLSHPLHVVEWMRTNERTPKTWVMPILTAPFDEGVAGAVSAHKPVDGAKE